MVETETDWQAEALRLKGEGMESKDIAERVGKSAATVRKVIARHREEVAAITADIEQNEMDAAIEGGYIPPSSNGNGNGHARIDAETADRLREAATGDGDPPSGPIPGQTDLADFIAEAGEAVGPMPPREMDGGETVYVEEITVKGTAQLGLFDAGGRTPESASVRLAGGKVGLVFGEAFRKGDTIRFSGTAVVTAVKQQDKRDAKTGQVVGCEQQHTALITDLTVAS